MAAEVYLAEGIFGGHKRNLANTFGVSELRIGLRVIRVGQCSLGKAIYQVDWVKRERNLKKD